MAAAFVLNSMLNEGWLQREHSGQSGILKQAGVGPRTSSAHQRREGITEIDLAIVPPMNLAVWVPAMFCVGSCSHGSCLFVQPIVAVPLQVEITVCIGVSQWRSGQAISDLPT